MSEASESAGQELITLTLTKDLWRSIKGQIADSVHQGAPLRQKMYEIKERDGAVVTTLSASTLDGMGFDMREIGNERILRLAAKVENDYMEQMYWTSVQILADIYEFPQKLMHNGRFNPNGKFTTEDLADAEVSILNYRIARLVSEPWHTLAHDEWLPLSERFTLNIAMDPATPLVANQRYFESFYAQYLPTVTVWIHTIADGNPSENYIELNWMEWYVGGGKHAER